MNPEDAYLAMKSNSTSRDELDSEMVNNTLEKYDAHYRMQFIADGEVVRTLTAYDIDGLIEQARKIQYSDVVWAEEKIQEALEDEHC
jgi:hypothetical protein